MSRGTPLCGLWAYALLWRVLRKRRDISRLAYARTTNCALCSITRGIVSFCIVYTEVLIRDRAQLHCAQRLPTIKPRARDTRVETWSK